MGALDPFARHKIKHLSPSSLNLYSEQPSFWCLKYLHQFKEEGDPWLWRGSAVEAGLDHWLYKRDAAQAEDAARSRFELEAMGEISDPIDKERISVCPMLVQATTLLGNHPEPVLRQNRVEYWFDGIEVPVIGYTDYEWENFGIDLKTTRRMPSAISPRHAKQISLYQAARNKPYKLLYVTEKKADIKELAEGEAKTWLKRLEWDAHAVRRVLSMFSSPHDLAKIFPPDFDHFFWRKEAARKAAMEIWNDT